jgi:hypothetical protein
MSLDVMKQALAVLEDYEPNEAHKVAVALRAAIEQAEEPVAWYVRFDTGRVKLLSAPVSSFRRAMWESAGKSFTVTPLYTAPRQWVGLTDEEIDSIDLPPSGTATVRDFIRLIEAKLKEKNHG